MPENRKDPCTLRSHGEGPYDLVIIGGGINGTGIARDAVMRGYSVALFDKGDLAGGTSSASSKMVHGGIRYLEQIRFGLVHESLRERHILLEQAPHLVRPQSFIIPVYAGSGRGPWKIRLGLRLYDLLCMGRRLGRSRYMGSREVLERIPPLADAGLRGGGLYFDAVMDDARLCLANAIAAREEAGARSVDFQLRTYTEVVEQESSTPIRLHLLDRASGRRSTVLARRVVRALGPWSDPETLVPSKGVHLVLPRQWEGDGLLLQHSVDNRVFFAIPWKDSLVVGTTETPHPDNPDRVRVETEDLDYLFCEIRRVLPQLPVSKSSIIGVFAGIRPLARARGLLAKLAGKGPGSVSRKHRIIEDSRGSFSLVGGKYTTYRAIAKNVCDRVFGRGGCTTHKHPLPGGEEGPLENLISNFAGTVLENLPAEETARLYRRYGCRLREVVDTSESNPQMAAPLVPGAAELKAEVLYCLQNEFLVYPGDFVDRRTTLRYGADGGRAAYRATEEMIRRHSKSLPADLEAASEDWFHRRDREDELCNPG